MIPRATFGCCIATGTPWLNHPVKQGGVVSVVGEGLRGLNKRFKAWSHHNGVSLDDAPLYYTHRPADFMTATSAKELVTSIKQMVGDQAIELIVIDTLARNMSGNESSPEDMAVFIGIIDRMLRAEFDCTVMPIHHPGVHDKTRARGTNALKGAVDTDIRMHHPDRDKHPDTVIFECMKQKNEDRFAPIVLDFKVLDWGRLDSRGNEIKSGLLVSSRGIDPKEFNIKSEALGKRARKALESLKKALKKHGGGAVPGQYWRDECASDGLNLDDNGKPMARSFRNVYSDAKAELFRKRYISTNDQGDIYPL